MSTQIDQIVDQIVYQYSLNPSVSLSVVSSSGSLDSINDTRLQAGAQSTSATAFPSESTTAEPGQLLPLIMIKFSETKITYTLTTDMVKHTLFIIHLVVIFKQ